MSDYTIKEVELLEMSLNGKTEAFAAIIEKYQSFVCGLTYSATGSVEKSEDLAQQVFVRCWMSLNQLKDLTKFRAWLCALARNIITDYYRKQKNDISNKAVPMDSIEEHASEDSNPVEAAISKEREVIINEALSKIAERYREPLVLYYREGRSYKQVAELLGFSEHTARERVSYARNLLKEKVASLVEETIERTKPSKAFTAMVVASIAGIAIKGTGMAAAAGIVKGSSATGFVGGVAAVMSGVKMAMIAAATVAVISVGAVVAYKQVVKPSHQSKFSQSRTVVQEQGEERSSSTKDFTEKPQAASFSETVKNETSLPLPKAASTVADDVDQAKPKTGISGVVIDKITSLPIKGAEIIYGPYNSRRSVPSDANGKFEALDMQSSPGQQFYVIAKSYATRTFALDIIANKVYQDFKVELCPGSNVSGTVTEPNGKPVEGVTVKTFHFTNHPVITGKDGEFEIDGLDPAFGQCILQATHPNYPSLQLEFSPQPAGQTAFVDLVLKPSITINGQVTNARGEPIAGVTVGNTTSRAMWNCVSYTTDKDGKYTLKNVPADKLVLWAVGSKFSPYVERFSLDSSEHTKSINIKMSDPFPLHGKIVDNDGNPVAGVSIELREYKGVTDLEDWNARVISDSGGKFTIPNAPPEGKVTLEVFSEFIGNVMPEFEAGQQQEYVITVERAGCLYGKVVNDKTGEPIERFNVKLDFSKEGNTKSGYSATWSRQGHSFESPKGFFDTGRENITVGSQYKVIVAADGFNPLAVDPIMVQAITEEPNRTEFRLKTASVVEGCVVDGSGAPIIGAAIRWLSEENKFEHWDTADMTTTDNKGKFKLFGVGSSKGCIFVTAEQYSPHLVLVSELPQNDANSIEIKLSPGAKIFGRIIESNGQGASGARVSAAIFMEQLQKIFNSPWPNLKEAIADANGNYEIPDLPAGPVTINVSTARRNIYLAHKELRLETGQSLEVNFGNEPGFTITGTVRMGQKLLELANVDISFPDRSMKWGQTDSKGRFIIKGVPKGTYSISTSYNAGLDTKWDTDQQFYDNKQVSVDANMILDIYFGDCSVKGQIPNQFLKYNELQISASRFVENPTMINGMPRKWEYAGYGKADSKGNFECHNLRPGRCYLMLNNSEETLAISDIFELGESQHLENITFRTGTGKIQIQTNDVETGQGISQAVFAIKNDLDAYFYSKKMVLDEKSYGMVTDVRGQAVYTDLPKGRYTVLVQAIGYLTSKSDWLDVNDDEAASAVIALNPASILRFELSEQQKQRINGETAYLRCRVINLDTQELVPMINLYGEEDKEHTVWLLPEKYTTSFGAMINLPEGRYEIKYLLYQDREGYLSYKLQAPLFEGTVNVELKKGESKLITISE